MSLLARFEPVVDGSSDRRRIPRLRLSLGTVINPRQSNVVIQNISQTGALFEASADLVAGDLIEVQLPEMASPKVARVAWREGELVGCEFENPISKAAVSAALLRSVPATHLQHQAILSDYQNRAGRVKTGVILTLILAGLTYLLLTASLANLVLVGSSLIMLFVLLVACCSWALDNIPLA